MTCIKYAGVEISSYRFNDYVCKSPGTQRLWTESPQVAL